VVLVGTLAPSLPEPALTAATHLPDQICTPSDDCTSILYEIRLASGAQLVVAGLLFVCFLFFFFFFVVMFLSRRSRTWSLLIHIGPRNYDFKEVLHRSIT
jgi:hypothetical protein